MRPVGKVKVLLPASLRLYWGGPPQTYVDAATLRDALAGLGPLATRVLDDSGALRPHVHVFVNHAPTRGLDAPLAEGDVVHILPAVSGGSSTWA